MYSFSISLVVVDGEELEFVDVLVCGDDSQVLTELLFLKVLLGQILEVSLGEGNLALNDSGVLVLANGDGLTKVGFLAFNLDVVNEPLDEVSKNEYVVLNGVSALDDVSVGWLLCLGSLLNLLDHL